MPRYIAEVGGKFCVWSSVVDAPVSPFLDSVEALEASMRARFEGAFFEVRWPWPGMRLTEADVTAYNRAGAPGGSGRCLNAAELLERYSESNYGRTAFVMEEAVVGTAHREVVVSE